jgi:D-alanine-D-alanine ligase
MDNTTRMKVGVLFGGRSAEHEVSILSARNVLAALDPERFEPVPIGITRDGRWIEQSMQRLLHDRGDPRAAQLAGEGPEISLLPRRREDAHITTARERGLDVIFPVLHGPQGEDGSVQGLLDLAGLPYVGAGVLGSAIGMDKDVMKRLLRDAGIAVARFVVLRRNDYRRNPLAVLREAEPLGYPLFVKPANLGSSVGVTRVVSREALPGALEAAFAYDLKVIIEEAIVGREIECSVLGNDTPVASVPGEIIVTHPDAFYSYDAKYVDDHAAELRVPARLDLVSQHAVQRLTLRTFKVLECSGLARVDFFLETGGRLLVNEINTLPGFTAISMYPKLWAASGVPPRELISRLIDLAVERHAQRRELRSVCSLRSGNSEKPRSC